MKKLLTRTQLELHKVAADQDYYSNQTGKILLEKDGSARATDGKLLCRVGPPEIDNGNWAARRETADCELGGQGETEEGSDVLMSKRTAERLSKSLPRHRKDYWWNTRNESIVAEVTGESTFEPGSEERGEREFKIKADEKDNLSGVEIREVQNFRSANYEPTPDKYPPIPYNDPQEFILVRHLDARLLRRICDFVIKANKEKPLLHLYVHKDSSKIEVRAKSELLEDIMMMMLCTKPEGWKHPDDKGRGKFVLTEEIPGGSLKRKNVIAPVERLDDSGKRRFK